MKNKFLSKAKEEVQLAYTRDSYMVQAVRSLDDLDEVKSLLFQRLDEWFKIHFPEMSLGSEENYAWFAAHATDKDVYDKLAELVGEPKADELKRKRRDSFGAPLEKEDQVAIKSLAETYLQLFATRKELEQYIEALCQQVMPNSSALVGGLISARLLSVAGSMERLATFPASTLQVLGAEKALFKHLKKGTLPPKHGLIFQSPYINGSPFDKRGKAARALAGKLAIGLKADFFTKKDISAGLLTDLEKRMSQITKLPTRNIVPKDYREMDYQRSREFAGGARRGGFQKGGFSGPRDGPRDGGFGRSGSREGGSGGFRRDGPRPEGGFRRDGLRREGGFGGGPRRFDSDRPRESDRPRYNDRPSFADRPRFGDRPAYGDKPRYGDRPKYGERSASNDRPRLGERPGFKERPAYGDKPAFSDKPRVSDRPKFGDKPSFSDKPRYGDKPAFGGGASGRPFKKKPFRRNE
ncbi:hypothetical protein HY994_05645 [Candidatus Micrarchaeota archaeon]|nr:hypothetical protein [Candidatus Micrarchaeota archaeon]